MFSLLHVTPRRNLSSIYKLGVNPDFAKCPRAECWFCSPSLRAWAIAHVAERHSVDPRDVVVIRVKVSPTQLTHRGKGLWTCSRVVREIVSVAVTFAPVAA
ncbi:MAG TPA: hypothetical protein DDY78_29175 [Planctomycetales bacterium]|jgi:histone acetyltransferase (RNA polymerase elongator complex component)|nr:hypothetical protein [Planctomycetales bacterium]